MEFIPRPHEIYRHFKGNLYQITAVAEHTETGELLVVYQALYGDFKIYARPLEMFLSKVDKEKYPDVEQEYRFELQGSERQRSERQTGELQEDQRQVVEQPNSELQTVASLTDEGGGDISAKSTEKDADILDIDPMVLEFLEAGTYDERLNILTALHHRITDEMITTMAVACDVEVPEGETQERYTSLKNCLLTLEKYECNRLR